MIDIILLCFVGIILLVISYIDAKTQEIPDVLVVAITVAGVVWVAIGGITWQNALVGAIAGALPLLIIDRLSLLLAKKDAFGYGDVKLMAAVGLFLGWQLVFVAFFFAFVSGGLVASAFLLAKKVERGQYIAFGPFLCLGSILAFYFGENFIAFLI